jgi:non-ribosomal peptide synthetase component F
VHFTFAVHRAKTAPGMREAVERRARKERGTSSVVCMAALLKLLSIHLGRPDVAAVTVFNRRGREELRGLLACVTNAATIAVSVPEGAGPREWIRATRDALLDAHANQRLFVSRVWEVAELSPGAVDVLFIYDGEFAPLTSFGGQPAHFHDYLHPRAYQRNGPWWENFKLRVNESGSTLGLTMEYNADLYEDATIEQLAAEYAEILSSFVEEEQLL